MNRSTSCYSQLTIITFAFLLFSPYFSSGQCATQIISNSTCIPATFKLNGPAFRTEWKRNNTLMATKDAAWDSIPEQVISSYKLTRLDQTEVASDAAGNIYIAAVGSGTIDNPHSTIQKWVPGAESGTTVTGPIPGGFGDGNNYLRGSLRFFLHGSGDLYVSVSYYNRIVKYPAGSTTGVVVAGINGLPGSANNQLNSPQGIYVDAAGNLFITDKLNHRIMRWAPGATSGTRVAGGNGQGSAANQLSNPADVQVVGNQIFIADPSNYRIQRWQVGAVTGVTVAGGNGAGTASNQIMNSDYFFVDRFNNVFCTGRITGGFTLQRWSSGATTGAVVAKIPSWRDCHFIDEDGNLMIADGVNDMVLRHRLKHSEPFIASSAGTYTATTYDAKGCIQNTNAIELLNWNGHEVRIVGESTLCEGSTGSFSANVTRPSAGSLELTWKRNGNTDTVINENFSYEALNLQGIESISVHVRQLSNGCMTKDTLVVNAITPRPPAGLLTSTSNCTPATLTYQFSTPLSSLVWYNVNNYSYTGMAPLWNEKEETIIRNPYNGNATLTTDFRPKVFRMNAAGEVLVLDQLYPRILKFMPGQSNYTVVIGGTTTGSSSTLLKDPTDFWIDTDGTIYVADNGNSRLMRYPAGSGIGVPIVTNISPNQLFVNQQWIYMSAGNTVYRSGKNGGTALRLINNGLGNASNQLANPISGLWVDPAENIYVADRNNHRIQRWPLFGSDGVTIAGGNGAGLAANQLTSPEGLYVDAFGSIITSSGSSALCIWMPYQDSSILLGNGFQPTVDSTGALLFISDYEVKKRDFIRQVQLPVLHDYYDKMISVSGVSSQNGCETVESTIQLSGGIAPTVTVNAFEDKPCEGTLARWDAVITQPGNNPKTEWWIDGQLAGTGNSFSSAALKNGDSLLCMVTNQVNKCYQKTFLPVELRPKPVIDLQSTQPIGVPTSIQLHADGVLPQVMWKQNGQNLDTTHNWKEYGRVVAGTSSIGADRKNVSFPEGIFVDSAGIFYTTDVWGIKQWWVGRETSDHLIGPGGGFRDIALFEDSFYVAASGTTAFGYENTVRRYPGSIDQLVVAGRRYHVGDSDSTLISPGEIWLQGNRDLFVVDALRLTKWPRGNNKCIEISDQYTSRPSGIVGDGSDNIFVVTQYGELFRYHLPTNTRQLLHSWVGSSFNTFEGIAIDRQGYLYLSAYGSPDEQGYVIRYHPSTDQSMIVAGGKGGGKGLNQLKTPLDLGLDESGNIFVADSRNNRVMMFTADSSKSRAITEAGIYTVTATGFNGCQITDSIHIYTGAYIFNGSGSDWNNPALWQGNAVPPPVIGDHFYLEINPVGTECMLNGDLRISRQSTLSVKPGKKLVVKGAIKIE